MSGQPYRYSSDIQNFRADYMDALNLKASIDDMNLKANQVYKATGQLPPQSSMPDTRTTAEKLADTTRLKVSLISELKTIGSPQFAQMVIQEVENSKLNANGSLFIFFAQNVQELLKNLNKKYALGIKGDANDATQFRLFVEHMYNDTKTLSGSVQSAFNRPYTQNRNLNLADLRAVRNEFSKLEVLISSKHVHDYRFFNITNSIIEIIEAIQLLEISADKVDILRQQYLTDTTNGIVSPITRRINKLANILNDIEQFLLLLPSVPTVYSGYDQLKSALKNQNNDLALQVLYNIRAMFPDLNTTNRLH